MNSMKEIKLMMEILNISYKANPLDVATANFKLNKIKRCNFKRINETGEEINCKKEGCINCKKIVQK